MFLQTVGLIPDNIICLESSRKKVEETINEKLRQIHANDSAYSFERAIKESVDESELNMKAVKEVFKGFFSEIPTSSRKKSDLIDEIAVTMKIYFINNYIFILLLFSIFKFFSYLNKIFYFQRIIKFKNKTNAARKPPKIILLGPPCSRKSEIARMIAQKYNICHVSISELLNKEIRQNNDNSALVLNHMNAGDLGDLNSYNKNKNIYVIFLYRINI